MFHHQIFLQPKIWPEIPQDNKLKTHSFEAQNRDLFMNFLTRDFQLEQKGRGSKSFKKIGCDFKLLKENVVVAGIDKVCVLIFLSLIQRKMIQEFQARKMELQANHKTKKKHDLSEKKTAWPLGFGFPHLFGPLEVPFPLLLEKPPGGLQQFSLEPQSWGKSGLEDYAG